MTVEEAIRRRTSVKSFSERPIRPQEIEQLLELAVQAPNHRMTEPWGFLVLGEQAKAAYAEVLAGRKAKNVSDPEAARMVRDKVMRRVLELPAMIAVTVHLSEDPEIREEDCAATWMGIQNICLAAVERGLGTHIKTGAVLQDPALREAWSMPDERRIVALIELGQPAGEPRVTERQPAGELTRWMD